MKVQAKKCYCIQETLWNPIASCWNSTKYFLCQSRECIRKDSGSLLSMFRNQRCHCGKVMSRVISPANFTLENGFVNETASLIIYDDMPVCLMFLEQVWELLRRLGIKDMMLLSTKLNEVLFVEAGKDFVDALFSFLKLPLGTVARLVLKEPNVQPIEVASLSSLYQSSQSDFNASDSSKINMEIVHRKSNGKIVFAQGKEDFADFLSSLLTIPLGGMLHLTEGCSSLGSVEGLSYWTSKEVKNNLVDRVLAPQFKLSNLMTSIYKDVSKYFCYTENSYTNLSHAHYIRAVITCTALEFVDSISETANSKGYVKGPIMYMATDDLVVTLMSSISVISLLSSVCIHVNDLEEKVINIGINVGVLILQASLTSTSVLTVSLSHLLTPR
ncbi:hypothetical protein HKD37_07G019123 [Glycine soja]